MAVEFGNQGYRWLLPALTSLQELGRLTSAQSIVAVANPILFGVSNFLGPVTARVHASQGTPGLWKHTIRSTAVLGSAIAIVLLGVAVFGRLIVVNLFGEAAQGVTTALLVTLGAGMLSQIMLIPIEFASLQLHKGRLLLQTAVVRLLVNLTLGVGLMTQMGAEGIGWGMLAGACVSMVWQWAVFAREAHRA
jgi:O-antigen/teichoic acid export membrane protein